MNCNRTQRFLFVFTILIHGFVTAQKCQKPTVTDGICIPVRDCNAIVQRLAIVNLTEYDKHELRGLQCETRDDMPYVCCDVHTLHPYRAVVEKFTNTNVKVSQKLGNLFPATNMCGVDLSSAIYSPDSVDIDEFSGMALLKYENDRIGCGGTLINHRYVLTAASCLTGEIVKKFGKIKSVRLGEHNLDIDPECTDLYSCLHYTEMNIEEIIVSKDFIVNAMHDVALIRLADDANVNVYKPICLTEPVDLHSNILRIVGWGVSIDGATTSERKYLRMDYLNETECDRKFQKRNALLGINRKRVHSICTVEQMRNKKGVCPIDGGGVLMAFSKNHKWNIAGLATSRPDCGLGTEVPAMYTDISKYKDWIKYNMRP